MIPILVRALIAVALVAPVAVRAQDTETHVYRGSVGSAEIGVVIRIEGDHRTVEAAKYFYVSKLVDIPLHATQDRDTVLLHEPGGGMFRLRFYGAGSETGSALDFHTSLGFRGTWRDRGVTYPVELALDSARQDTGERWYEQVTKRSDAEFEATVRRFLHGATTRNLAETASATQFPLQINGLRKYVIKSPAQLKSNWARIFTRAYAAKLKAAVPHYMFVHEGRAMIGRGELWFDDKGATELNTQ